MQSDRNMPLPESREIERRKQWMGVLARATATQLEAALAECGPLPEFEYLRRPEIGMVMVRGRADAKGDQFNLGEMTVSRCSVKNADGLVGHGYVAGRNKRHAELAAVFDALLQSFEHGSVCREVIATLAGEQHVARKKRNAKTAATKVNFFTMVRGED